MNLGDEDGHGRYGILDLTTDGLLVCHDCGGGYSHLATHVRLAHGYATAEAYREAHGLARKTALVAPATSQRMSDAWESGRSWREPLLLAVRQPGEAYKAPRKRLRVQARAARATAEPSRDLTTAEIESLGDWWDVPAWAERAHALIAREGVTQVAIARSLGVSISTVAQRLRRYPA